MMAKIGGYFGLEECLNDALNEPCNESGLALHSGRACLAHLIKKESPKRAFIPSYSCRSLIYPFLKNCIKTQYYSINHLLEPDKLPELEKSDVFVYINYFGIKKTTANQLEKKYLHQLWIDNTQALFEKSGTGQSWRFNSARKSVGVPDGATITGPDSKDLSVVDYEVNNRFTTNHLLLRQHGLLEEGREWFLKNEELLDKGGIRKISSFSKQILSRLNSDLICFKRTENFEQLHCRLGAVNFLSEGIIQAHVEATPFCYPFLPMKKIEHSALWKNGVFAPIFWPECNETGSPCTQYEKYFAANLLPLPIDQRYSISDMDYIADIILNYAK
jgi:hypothetical protein